MLTVKCRDESSSEMGGTPEPSSTSHLISDSGSPESPGTSVLISDSTPEPPQQVLNMVVHNLGRVGTVTDIGFGLD